MAKKKKVRAEFRKNRTVRARKSNWTRQFDEHGFQDKATDSGERLSGKGDLNRRRTIMGTASSVSADGSEGPFQVHLDVDEVHCLQGRVLSVFGLSSDVLGDNGQRYQCATRRILKTLVTDERNVVAAGDRVAFLTVPNTQPEEGVIERIEPRHGTISRAVGGKRHVLVANVDQLLIITSAIEPRMKPNLIDRLLVAAEKGRVRPIICINKIDKIDASELQPLVGVYSRMGYMVLLVSAKTGQGVERFRRLLAGRQSVVSGQSGVGKSSLLNTVDPTFNLRVGRVSEETEKGRHTTTTARLLPIGAAGHPDGYVVDTPGMRHFELWDVSPEEIGGYYRDIRPYVSLCRYPDCTHTHEDACAVKNAVAQGHLDIRRYESYCHLRNG
jgi:ribosome biogenesis GTPase